MSNLTEIVAKFGNTDKNMDLGNGFNLITRHAINGNQIIVESELYKNGERIYNPIDCDEDELPEDQYDAMSEAENSQKEGQMMAIPEGLIKTPAKMVWYAIGDTYSVKDSLKAAGMTWDSSLKLWGKLSKPEVDGVEFVQIKTYKTENGWTYY